MYESEIEYLEKSLRKPEVTWHAIPILGQIASSALTTEGANDLAQRIADTIPDYHHIRHLIKIVRSYCHDTCKIVISVDEIRKTFAKVLSKDESHPLASTAG